MARSLLLLAVLVAPAGAVVAIDQPDGWADPATSHHDKHAMLGSVVGFVGYALAATVTDDRADRYITGVTAGCGTGVGYEIARGLGGKSYMDPVDAAWTAAGSIAGCVLADYFGQAVQFAVSADSASFGAQFRF